MSGQHCWLPVLDSSWTVVHGRPGVLIWKRIRLLFIHWQICRHSFSLSVYINKKKGEPSLHGVYTSLYIREIVMSSHVKMTKTTVYFFQCHLNMSLSSQLKPDI